MGQRLKLFELRVQKPLSNAVDLLWIVLYNEVTRR